MSEMKKVKLMAHGLPYGSMGQVVEVPAHVAELMCKERSHHDGYSTKKVRVAVPAEEAEEMEKALAEAKANPTPALLANLSQAEAEAMGIKNVTPSDPNDIGEVNKIAASRKAKAKK